MRYALCAMRISTDFWILDSGFFDFRLRIEANNKLKGGSEHENGLSTW
jgi:hypothetical protein